MAKQTREEWLATLQPGDRISVTFPGAKAPEVGVVLIGNGKRLTGQFQRHPLRVVRWLVRALRRWADRLDRGVYTFNDGHLRGRPNAKLWMVATGSGGSVGPRIVVSNRGIDAAE